MSRKLTREQVQEARTRHYQNGEAYAALARIFHVSSTTMRAAILGETWKEVPITYRRATTERKAA